MKDYLKGIDEKFETFDKALVSTLMINTCSMKFTSTKGVHEQVTKIRDIAAQLKSLEIEMSESFLVHFILNSLPSQYGPSRFHTTYLTRNGLSINC